MTKEQMTHLLARLQQLQQEVVGKACDFKIATYKEFDEDKTQAFPAVSFSVFHNDSYVDSGILHGTDSYEEGCKAVESFEFNLRHIGWI